MVDVQELVRWLVDAKIHVAEALPIVSSLAAEGVTSTDDLASLDDDALVKAVKQKSYLKKIRSKIGKGADKKGKKRSGSSQPSGQAKRAKRGGSSDVPKVSPAPECDFSSAQLREIEIKINRSPVIILWATVVAQRLSFDWSESLSIGKAVANWLAQRKGEFYGILEPVEQGVTDATVQEEKDETTKIQRLEMMGEEIVLHQTECGWRAVSNGKLIQPGQVHSHLRKVYGADFGAARQAMIQLGGWR
ncbi:unnamed protein product [Choristocarpus tenellus]